ncbi:hypothetical protein [Staphylococcus simulans]|mgnify:CR=1 FL=1|uniref:hypothetical protein n=1 Tax=Staphylococcus simulans TaxID=1286 RepID=UPI003F8129BF
MNKEELNQFIAAYRKQQTKRQPSMAQRIKKDGRDYAKLNNRFAIKTPNGPSKEARPMTKKEMYTTGNSKL